jgi:hypothetical protein
MRMRACYLLIHIEGLLYQLQLFYFHLLPIYWLPRSFIVSGTCEPCPGWDSKQVPHEYD